MQIYFFFTDTMISTRYFSSRFCDFPVLFMFYGQNSSFFSVSFQFVCLHLFVRMTIRNDYERSDSECQMRLSNAMYALQHLAYSTRVSVAHTKFELGFQIWIVWKGATINSYQKTVCSLHHMYHHFHLISSLIINLWFSVIFCRNRQKSFNDLSYCPKLYCYLSE